MKIDFNKEELAVLSALAYDATKKAMVTVLENPRVVTESDFYLSLATINFKLRHAVEDMKESDGE